VPLGIIEGSVPLRIIEGWVPLGIIEGSVPLVIIKGSVPLAIIESSMPLANIDGSVPLGIIEGLVPLGIIEGSVPLAIIGNNEFGSEGDNKILFEDPRSWPEEVQQVQEEASLANCTSMVQLQEAYVKTGMHWRWMGKHPLPSSAVHNASMELQKLYRI
jgi:hypothetical protein